MALRFNFYKVALIDQIQEMNLKTPKSSYFNNSADPILIDGNGGWVSAATNEDWCTLINSVYVIENLTIRGQSETICIEIKNSDVSFLIRNCTLYNAGGTVVGYPGLKLDNVTNGIIIKNNISNNYDIGIILDDSSNNTITENHIENNEHCGILFRDNSDFNKIFNNTFMSNENYGIQLEWESNVNAVYENIIKESTGVYIWGDDNQIFDNKFIRCWNGISIEGADNITIMNNFITDIDTTLSGYAISLEDANLNMIYNNLITVIGGKRGISLEESNQNYIISNKISNTSRAIQLSLGSNDNIVYDNLVYYNGGGIVIANCESNAIESNIIANSKDNGLFLESCFNNTIRNNTINNNDIGISLMSGINNTITTNNISDNEEYGINLVNSHNNTISFNVLIGNLYCIVESGCEGNRIINNTCENRFIPDFNKRISGYNSLFIIGILLIISFIIIQKKNTKKKTPTL